MSREILHFSRRRFLRTSAAVAAASTLPNWFLQECQARPKATPALSPNDQPAIALVGCGGMGRADAKNASRFGRIVAICDWDFWKGPTPDVEHVKERCHFSFRYWFEYSGGTLTDWGAHHNDIALWGLGLQRSGPVAVEAEALSRPIPGGYSAIADYRIEFTYPNGVKHTCESTRDNNISGGVVNADGKLHGVRFEGADGWIWVTRGKIEASDPEMLSEPLPSKAERLYVSDDHMGNFFECVRTRKPPICDAEIGHRSATICHLGAIALQLGRKLKWNPKKEEFVGDKEANAYLAREMRQPWSYE